MKTNLLSMAGAGFLILALTVCATAADFYVSPAGNDANTGAGAQPSQALRTIQAAVNKLQPGDTCLVLAGTYREKVTFPRSGQPGQPITLKPYQDQKVVVSGCDPVTGWTRHKGQIWKAPMNWTLGPGRNQVFDGDGVLIEARFPNKPSPGLDFPVAGLSTLWPAYGDFSDPEPKKAPHRLTSKLLDGQPEDFWKGAIYYGVHYGAWGGAVGGRLSVRNRARSRWAMMSAGAGRWPIPMRPTMGAARLSGI